MLAYRSIGIKLTPQRLAILGYLEGNKTHPSAEEIYRGLHKRFPTMSLATVYATLTALRDKGHVNELVVGPGKKRYDPDSRQHDHALCMKCGSIIDVPRESDLVPPDSLTREFDLVKTSIQYCGYCFTCKSNNATKPEEDSHVRRS